MMTYVWTMLRLALILIALAWPARAADWSGPAESVDGHTLVINGQRLRLSGIESVGLDQTCESRYYFPYHCGWQAKQHLDWLVRDKQVTCSGTDWDWDWYQLPQVRCTAGDLNLNREMVRAGWAVVYRSEEYRPEQDLAKQAGDGLWQGRIYGR